MSTRSWRVIRTRICPSATSCIKQLSSLAFFPSYLSFHSFRLCIRPVGWEAEGGTVVPSKAVASDLKATSLAK